MAYLGEDDKLKQEGEEQGQLQSGGSGQSFVSGNSGASDVGQSTSTAGVGKGGGGNWTNIQAYMNADKNNESSSKLLGENLTPKIEGEKSRLGAESTKFKSGVDEGAGKIYSTDEIDQESKALSGGYKHNWGYKPTKVGESTPNLDQGEDYNSRTKKVSDFLTRKYSGPDKFDYTIGEDTAKSNEAMNTDEAFNEYMNKIYSGVAKQGLTSGQQALQNQLNVAHGSKLSEKRKSFQDEFKKLQSSVGSEAEGLGKYVNEKKSGLVNAQNAARSFLEGGLSSNDAALAAANSKSEKDAEALREQYRTGAKRNWDRHSEADRREYFNDAKKAWETVTDQEKLQGDYNTLAAMLGYSPDKMRTAPSYRSHIGEAPEESKYMNVDRVWEPRQQGTSPSSGSPGATNESGPVVDRVVSGDPLDTLNPHPVSNDFTNAESSFTKEIAKRDPVAGAIRSFLGF